MSKKNVFWFIGGLIAIASVVCLAWFLNRSSTLVINTPYKSISVTIDNKTDVISKTKVYVLKPGTYSVKANLDNYQQFFTTVNLKDKESSSLIIKLVPALNPPSPSNIKSSGVDINSDYKGYIVSSVETFQDGFWAVLKLKNPRYLSLEPVIVVMKYQANQWKTAAGPGTNLDSGNLPNDTPDEVLYYLKTNNYLTGSQ